MKIINNPNKSDWTKILKRPTQTVDDIEATVNQIFEEVNQKGDEAIKNTPHKFDGITLESNLVTSEEIENAAESSFRKASKRN